MVKKFDEGTPLSFLTVADLKALLSEIPVSAKEISPPNLVYGLKGISRLFNCSLSHAQELKQTVIKDAVAQRGRTIVVDVKKALELFTQHSRTKKK